MEQVRLLLAIGISFAVFFVWSIFFAPQPPQPAKEAASTESQTQNAEQKRIASQPSSAPPAQSQVAIPQPGTSAPPVQPGRKISIDTPLYTMIITESGAEIKSVVLKAYRETMDIERMTIALFYEGFCC